MNWRNPMRYIVSDVPASLIRQQSPEIERNVFIETIFHSFITKKIVQRAQLQTTVLSWSESMTTGEFDNLPNSRLNLWSEQVDGDDPILSKIRTHSRIDDRSSRFFKQRRIANELCNVL